MNQKKGMEVVEGGKIDWWNNENICRQKVHM